MPRPLAVALRVFATKCTDAVDPRRPRYAGGLRTTTTPSPEKTVENAKLGLLQNRGPVLLLCDETRARDVLRFVKRFVTHLQIYVVTLRLTKAQAEA